MCNHDESELLYDTFGYAYCPLCEDEVIEAGPKRAVAHRGLQYGFFAQLNEGCHVRCKDIVEWPGVKVVRTIHDPACVWHR